MKNHLIPALLFGSRLLFAASPGLAQDASPPIKTEEEAAAKKSGAAAKPDKQHEKFQVTGSRIKRFDVETSAPVTVIDKAEIQKTGATSVGDLMRKSASSSPTGNFSGSSGYVSQGASSVDLLGIGASRSLVLLNGKRLPSIGGIDAVNIDNIPIGIIEKVEILAGGASAVYGADAVGGVVNITTRKDFEGTEFSIFSSVPTHAGGEELELNAVQGVTFSDGHNLILSAGARSRNPIDKRNRDLAYSAPERVNTLSAAPAGTYSYRPASVSNDKLNPGNWKPSANCPSERQVATVPSKPDDVYCTGLRKEIPSELIPRKLDTFAAANFDFKVNQDWSLGALISFSRSVNTANSGRSIRTAIDPINNTPIRLSNARARELGVISSTDTSEFVEIYAPIPEAPELSYINTFDTLSSSLSLDGTLGQDWKAQGGLSFSKSDTTRKGKNIGNSDTLSAIFTDSSSSKKFGEDPAYVPIDPNKNGQLFADAFTELKSTLLNQNTIADFFLSKDLAKLPAGNFTLGFGGSYAVEKFKLTPDDRDTQFNVNKEPLYTGTFADRGSGDRKISSAYAEFVAPVATAVVVEGALRFDHFSDFDNATNFGLGTKISASSFLGFRARAASSFKAPSLSDIHQEGGGGYYSITDPTWCARENRENRVCETSNPSRQVYVNQPGNKNLKPELGLNYIAGIILDPVPGLSLVSDYHWVNLKKTFQTDEIQKVVDQWYQDNPDSKTGGVLNDNTVDVDADGVISTVGLPVRNLGALEVRAVDTKLNYSLNIEKVRLGFESQFFRMMSYKVQEVQDSPIRQQVGYFGVPKWRWNNRINVNFGDHDMTLSSRTIAGQSQDPTTADADSLNSKVGPYTEYDAVYSTDLPWNGSIQLGVNDIFDTIGGKEDGNSLRSENVASSSIYSYVGRSYFARLTQKF